MAPGRIIKAEADDFEALSGAGKACCSGEPPFIEMTSLR